MTSCITKVPIFSNLTREEMLEIGAITSGKFFHKGENIYLAGDVVEELYVIHTGGVKISRLGINGKEQVIRVLGPGEFMNELSLFHSVESTDNAEALEDSAMCIIEGRKLQTLVRKYPQIAFKIIEEIGSRLEKAEKLIENINLYSVEQRLAQALWNFSKDQKEIKLKMTKGDFASQIGMSQETLSRKLAAFEAQGLIALKGQRGIIVLDREALKEI